MPPPNARAEEGASAGGARRGLGGLGRGLGGRGGLGFVVPVHFAAEVKVGRPLADTRWRATDTLPILAEHLLRTSTTHGCPSSS